MSVLFSLSLSPASSLHQMQDKLFITLESTI